MKTKASRSATLCLALLLGPAGSTFAQIDDADMVPPRRSPATAAALSLLLPGLGQRYANHGSWRGTATIFVIADVATWVGLTRTIQSRNQRINSYTALAASRASAVVDGKDRSFFLNLATYRSSDEYLEIQLRNRAWDQIDYASDPDFRWEWANDEDFLAFRGLRDDAESLDRRKSVLIATLVANRLVSAFVAVRAANRANRTALQSLSLSPPRRGDRYPTVHAAFSL